MQETALIPSHANHRATSDGRIQRLIGDHWKDLPQNVNIVTGYVTVSINRESLLVHRLVLEAFVGPCPEGMEARHFPDFDKTNNAITNLSWATHAVNCGDRANIPVNRALTDEQAKSVFLLRRLFKASELAELFNVSVGVIRRIWKARIYRHALRTIPQSTPNLQRWYLQGI